MTGWLHRSFSLLSRISKRILFTLMTLDEIQREAAALSEEERLRLRAFLKHLERVDSDENRRELARLNAEIDAGKYFTLEDFQKMHADLLAEGR